ncbi:hypothetical protein [Spirosoma fluminis]
MQHRTINRLLPTVIAVGILIATAAVAQDSTQRYLRPALVKTNLTGPFSLLVEVPTVHQQSLQLGAKSLTWGLFGKSTFFNITPEYRFYLSKQPPSAHRPAPKGFYVSPYLRYQSVVEEHIGILGSQKYGTVFYSMFGGGAVIGTQFISRGGFVLDAFLGAGYFPLMQYRITTERTTYYPLDAKPEDYRFDLRLGLCIGLAF